MAKPKMVRRVLHPLLGEMGVPVDVLEAAKAYPQLDPDDPVQRAALEKIIKKEMREHELEHDKIVLAQLRAEEAAREQATRERVSREGPLVLETASGKDLDRIAVSTGYPRVFGETDERLRERITRDAIAYPILADRIRAGGGVLTADDDAYAGASTTTNTISVGAREETSVADYEDEEAMEEEEAEGFVDKAKDQAGKLGGAMALGAKLVAVNQAGELMLRVAHKIAAKSPGSSIAALLEDEDGREVAKAIVAFGLHSAGTYAPLPKGREALCKIGELQLAASTFILGNKYGGLIMAELDELIGLGDSIIEAERVAELGPGAPRALEDVKVPETDGVRVRESQTG